LKDSPPNPDCAARCPQNAFIRFSTLLRMPHAVAQPATLPLAQYAVIATHDLDQARDEVARIFCPHRLHLGHGNARFDARHHVAPLGDISLNYVQYGAEVEIDPGCLGDFYLLQIPLRGSAQIDWAGRSFTSDAHRASLASPSKPLRMRWGDDTPHLIVKIATAVVQRHWASLCGEPVGDRPLEFEPALALDEGAGASVKHLVDFLAQELSCGRTTLTTPFLAQAESGLIHMLLGQLPHNQSGRLRTPRGDVSPRGVRRARDYIEAHLAAPLTVDEIASASGLCVRSLQLAFREHDGQTPMAYLRERRLLAVQRCLAAPAHDTTVTSAALACGFGHLGRFAQDYARRFGESPHRTLLRHR
jgi:AraC-like DNA-binding protein